MDKILHKYLQDPNSISNNKKNKLLTWCFFNLNYQSNMIEIIDKLCNRIYIPLDILDDIFITQNNDLILKYFHKFQNYVDMEYCFTYCNDVNLCKLIYDELEHHSCFQENKTNYVCQGYIYAIINNNENIVEYIKQRYPEIDLEKICDQDIIESYSTICLSCINNNVKGYKFISEKLASKNQLPIDNNKTWLTILWYIFDKFQRLYEKFNNINKLFFDIVDLIIDKCQFTLDQILFLNQPNKITYHLLNKNNLATNVNSLNIEFLNLVYVS